MTTRAAGRLPPDHVTIPLVHMAPTERELAVSQVRADPALDRTGWPPVPQRR